MKKIIILTFLLVLGITYIFLDSYGLLETNGVGIADFSVANWQIELNGEDISLEKTLTISDFVFDENENVEDGYFAPGVKANYEISIDVSNCDVSVDYEWNIEAEILDSHPNIIMSIENSDGEATSGTIYLNDMDKEKKFNISLEWLQNDEFNELDSELINQEIPIILEVHFSQHIEE